MPAQRQARPRPRMQVIPDSYSREALFRQSLVVKKRRSASAAGDYARQRGGEAALGSYCSHACPFGQLVARAITVWILVLRSAACWKKRANASTERGRSE